METPPPSELQAARNRMTIGAESLRPGTATIGGVPYEGAVHIGPETFALTERGQQKVQQCRAIIRKSKLATQPTQGASIKIGGLAFKIVEVDGCNSGDDSWHITGQRTPGGDS